MSVSYTRITFRNRMVQSSRAYKHETPNQDGSIDHTPVPGEIYQGGTKLNANVMNTLDKGIDDCAKAINVIEEELIQKQNTLTFDSTPTANSQNPVTSGGLYTVFANKIKKFTATIPTTGWTSQQSGAYYTINLTVSGILASDTPDIGIVQTGTWATDEAIRDAWACITRIVASSANTLNITAQTVPPVQIPIQVRCIR